MVSIAVDPHTSSLLSEQMRHFHFTNKEIEGYTLSFLLKEEKSMYRLWGLLR